MPALSADSSKLIIEFSMQLIEENGKVVDFVKLSEISLKKEVSNFRCILLSDYR